MALRPDGRVVAGLAPRGKREASRRNLPNAESYSLLASPDGRLDALQFVAAHRRAPARAEVEISVEMTGLNFKDLLVALARNTGGNGAPLGGECAGVVARVGEGVLDLQPGDRVVALAEGAFSRYLTVPRAICARIPDGVRLEDAVCLPANFVTATLALQKVGRVMSGDTVLIHAAAGGTGSAAVQVARRLGASVVATGRPWKWAYVNRLGVVRVASSRDATFGSAVRATPRYPRPHLLFHSLSG